MIILESFSDLINKNINYNNLANYILVRYPNINIEQAKNIIQKLLNEYKFTEDQILKGDANNTISLLVKTTLNKESPKKAFNSEDNISKLVDDNISYNEISKYIAKKSNLIIAELTKEGKLDGLVSINYDITLIKEYVKRLVFEYKFSKDQILRGEADNVIALFVRTQVLKNNSIANDKEKKEDKGVILKTKKKIVRKKIITNIITFIFLISTIVAIKNYISREDNVDIEKEVASQLASLAGNSSYNIVEGNMYISSMQNNGPLVAYSNDKNAEDIIDVCKKDPALFSVAIHNVYTSMDTNRLANMDEVLYYLKLFLKQEESLHSLYEEIKDFDVFLEFLVAKGYAQDNKDLITNDIEDYKMLAKTYRSPFTKLSKEAQDRILEMIEIYKENKDLYNDAQEIIDGLNDEEPGMGGR